jgi:phosphate-selective porin OprO/OprP
MLGALRGAVQLRGEFQLRASDDKAPATALELHLDCIVNALAANCEASSPVAAESTPAFFLAHEATAGTSETLVFADNEGENQELVPLNSFFGEGFELESWDRQIQLRIRVLNQVDGKYFSPHDQEPARSGLYIPRFRIYLVGQLTSLVEYELSLQRSVEGAFDVLDANVNFVTSEALQIRIGRALVPYSYSWYDHLEQYYITPERGLFPLNFGLARQAGIFAHGKLVDERVQYAVGTTFGQLSGLADTNNTRDAVGYVNVRPFLQSDRVPRFRFLNLGGSLSIGRQVDPAAPLPLRTSIQTSENDEAAQAASSIFLRFADGVVAKGERLQGALHLACYSGPISFEAEWFAARFGMASGVAVPAIGVPVSGYDITVASFLTGETVEDRTDVTPLRPVTRDQLGVGAFELFGRYSKLQLGQQIFAAGLVDQADWTNSAAITDIGSHWYLNRFVRCTFDWQHSFYATPVLLNAAENLRLRHNDLYWFRCQFYF